MILGPASPALWGGFLLLVAILLALDLGVFHRKAHVISSKESLLWTFFWVGLALVFNAFVFLFLGREKGIDFFTGFLIEKSLSVDNLFVIAMVFTTFGVPRLYQHRVLFWGILGAIILRGVMILVGVQLIVRFHWIIYVFGAFLLVTGFRLLVHKDEVVDPGQNPLVRVVRKILPVSPSYEGARFFVRKAGKLMATPLFIVLIIVESTDLIFAVDSIPAIFAVTADPFLVYTSNALAILGLRSLYFLLAGVIGMFRFLKPALSAILVFIGVKMLLSEVYPIPTTISLSVVGALLLGSILLSLAAPGKRWAPS